MLQLCASWRSEIDGRKEGGKKYTEPFLWHCRWSDGTGAQRKRESDGWSEGQNAIRGRSGDIKRGGKS